MNKELIEKALTFYNVDDAFYKEKCLECISYINDNLQFKNKVLEVCNILYNKKNYLLAKLWKIKEPSIIFGKNYYPFVTSIIILFGYKLHQENMSKYNLDEHQIKIHKKRVKETLLNDIYKRHFKSVRISQMLWASYFINLRIIEVGILQYELVDYNPITLRKEVCIKIHIPRMNKLNINKVNYSISKSNEEIYKYYGIKDANYYCESWLLSPTVLNLLDSKSNIVKFSKLFCVEEKESCTNDILNFVFDDVFCKDYNLLKEDTSLQKNLKKFLLTNKDINIGIGKLK